MMHSNSDQIAFWNDRPASAGAFEKNRKLPADKAGDNLFGSNPRRMRRTTNASK
jgi:hypothetical protein